MHNHITIHGYLGRDPELKEYKNAQGETRSLVNFSVGVSRVGDGTDWFDVTFFGRRAEVIEKFFRKGSQIVVTGLMQADTVETDGKKRKFWKLIIASLLWAVTCIPIVTKGWADAGLTFITRNFSREKHAFIKEDFFETIKKNRKNALTIGILNLIVTGILFYNLVSLIPVMIPGLYALVGVAQEDIPAARELGIVESIILALSLMGYVTFTWMKYYIPFLMITFKLNVKQIYKNAFLFAGSNMKVNLMISAILLVLYGLMVGVVVLFPNTYVLVIVLALGVSVVPAFRSFLIQYSIFPAIKRLIIDPYYKENPDADKQARYDLNLDVDEYVDHSAAPAESTAPAAEDEPIFTDVVPTKEEAPARTLPKQYNEKELRHFNRQVRNRADDDDDDTI